MSNKKPKVSRSQIAGGTKLQLLPDSPLTKSLKTEHFDLLDPNTFEVDVSASTATISVANPVDSQLQDDTADDYIDSEAVDAPHYPAPNIEDISVLSKTLKTDANGKQYWEFKFRVLNKMGDRTMGAGGYVA